MASEKKTPEGGTRRDVPVSSDEIDRDLRVATQRLNQLRDSL